MAARTEHEQCATREVAIVVWSGILQRRTREGQRRRMQMADGFVVCAEQRINQEGSSPSGARMRSAVSKSGGNASLAEAIERYGEAF